MASGWKEGEWKEGKYLKNGIGFLIGYSWKHEKWYVIDSILLQMITAAVPLADTVIPKYIIDELTGMQRVPVLAVFIGLLLIINLLGGWLSNYLSGKCINLKGRLFALFQADLSERLSRSDFERLEDPKFLDTKAKAEKFLYANGQGFGVVMDSAFQILGKLFTFAGIITIISTLNPLIVLLFIALVLLNALYESKVRKKYVSWDMEKAPIERKTSYLVDLIGNFSFGKEVRIFGLKDWLVKKIRLHLDESCDFYKKQINELNKANYLATFMNFVFKGITYGYLSFQVIRKAIGIGDFTMYITALLNFSTAMNALMKSLLDIRQFSGYYDALMDYMDIPQKMRQGKRLPLPQGPYEIRFEHVSFRYPGQSSYALKDINITLSPEEKLSVVGENGAGKTTFVKLLCRLYDPTQGRILLNGIDIRDIDYDAYMQAFGCVFQDYKLLSFTLKENIVFERSDEETDQMVYDLLCRSGLSDKMKNLPDGVRTYVYKNFVENGFEPSGGEGQKIALARALYKDSSIIILDEPTSALDPKAEAEIYKNFSELVYGKTAIFISHRMSSSKFCDQIAVFENGEMKEYGTHEQLMRQKGTYYTMFELQAQYYV